jgi:hypothetical protein
LPLNHKSNRFNEPALADPADSAKSLIVGRVCFGPEPHRRFDSTLPGRAIHSGAALPRAYFSTPTPCFRFAPGTRAAPLKPEGPTGDLMKKLRLPLLLVVLLTLMPVVSTISTPVPALAKTQIENESGEEMDGDPENYNGAPKGIQLKEPQTPINDVSQKQDSTAKFLLLLIKMYVARLIHGI